MSNTEEFLDLYKRVEACARQRYGIEREDSPIFYLMNRCREFRDVRQKLNICREVRNLLQHCQKIDGCYPIEVQDVLINVLKDVIDRFENPICAYDIATKRSKLYARTLNDPVVETIASMLRKGVHCVPILEKDSVCGVFTGTSLEGIQKEHLPAAFRELKDMGLLDLNRTAKETFAFVPRDMTFDDLDVLFESYAKQGKIVRALFVTQTGEKHQRLLGIITATDMMGFDEK